VKKRRGARKTEKITAEKQKKNYWLNSTVLKRKTEITRNSTSETKGIGKGKGTMQSSVEKKLSVGKKTKGKVTSTPPSDKGGAWDESAGGEKKTVTTKRASSEGHLKRSPNRQRSKYIVELSDTFITKATGEIIKKKEVKVKNGVRSIE